MTVAHRAVLPMPRLPDQFLDAVAYLYPTVDAAHRGVHMGGTGFLVQIRFEPPYEETAHLYLVTNRHVALNAPVPRFNHRVHGTRTKDLSLHDWTFHPDGDDVAIWRVTTDMSEVDFKSIPIELFATEDDYGNLGLGLGDECLMIGRFVGIDETDRIRPSARFGNLARTDTVPVKQHQFGIAQDSLLVETRSLGGFSGSPVFAYHDLAISIDPNVASGWSVLSLVSSPFRAIGIDHAHLPRFGQVYEADQRTPVEPSRFAVENSGLMAVVPSWKLLGLIHDDSEVAKRADVERDWAQRHAPVIAAVEDDESQGDAS